MQKRCWADTDGHRALFSRALHYSWNLLSLIHGRVKEIQITRVTGSSDVALFPLGRDTGLRWCCDFTGRNSNPSSLHLNCDFSV